MGGGGGRIKSISRARISTTKGRERARGELERAGGLKGQGGGRAGGSREAGADLHWGRWSTKTRIKPRETTVTPSARLRQKCRWSPHNLPGAAGDAQTSFFPFPPPVSSLTEYQ